MTKVYVDGQEGTTGLRIHEYLAARDDVALLRIDPAQRKDPAVRRELLNAADIAFLCLPDDAARDAVAMIDNQRTTVINASTAFRTHPDWAYGLPELSPEYRERVRTVNRISVPGCHASAFLLALAPLVRRGLVPADARIDAFSITGYSGGGKKMIASYEAGGQKYKSPRPYALGMTHKHLPEMQLHAGLSHAPGFVPVVGDFYKGLAVTIYLRPRALGVAPIELHDALTQHYANEDFVRVLPMDPDITLDDGFFDAQACNDSNRADICLFGNDERAALVCRLDNLGKGASGAAIQCMNARLGKPEGLGLSKPIIV